MSHADHHHHHGDNFAMAAHITVHCLAGCVIGEVAGLAIGVTLGLGVWMTIALATGLSYLSGLSLGVWPVMRREQIGFWAAFKLIWIGEVISIGVMELAMNLTDYHIGGVTSGSILSGTFWLALLVAIPAGFLAAWPVNWVLLKQGLRDHH